VVAVVDAGIDADHPDLAGQLWVNPGEVAGNGLDDDKNGCVDDLHGWNMVDDNADLSDATGHGTAMAGIIAAVRNGQGITGVCPTCRIMVVKVTGSDGQAQYHDIAEGITYAAQNGADVINVSLRGKVNSGTLWKAVNEASRRAIVVSGAGNDGSASPVYPGAYGRVLAVAAVGRDGTKLASSGYGAWVDVAAPGSQITTSRTGGGHWAKSGTSVSAAVASGLAGLLKCQHADWSPEEVRRQIILTAERIDEMNPGYQDQLGSGRVNAGKAFTASLRTRPWEPVAPAQEQLAHWIEMGIRLDLALAS
jgi:subtilisin family serine protease